MKLYLKILNTSVFLISATSSNIFFIFHIFILYVFIFYVFIFYVFIFYVFSSLLFLQGRQTSWRRLPMKSGL